MLLVTPTGPQGQHIKGTQLLWPAPMEGDGWVEALHVGQLHLWVARRSPLAARLGLR